MKKILIFSLQYYPLVGGAEVAIKEITNRISPEEVEFHLVTLRFDSTLPRQEQIENVMVHRIGFSLQKPSPADLKKFPLHFLKHWYQLGAFFAAIRLHRTYRFDGIWAMMAHSTGVPAGLFKTLHPEIKYLLTLQEGDPPEHIERLALPVWPLFVRGFTKADQLQALSNFLIAWGKRMGFRGEGVLVPNGTDVQQFTRRLQPAARTHERALLGVQPRDTMLVSSSRLVHKNAMDDVIKAIALLPSTVRFVNYGFGPDKAELEVLAKTLGVQDRIRLLDHPGVPALPEYVSLGDIFIRPSRSEGQGISFIEAMAAGLPVIATQEGGIADFLFDEKRNPDRPTTGWAVDKDSPEQIAEAVKDIIARPEKVREVTETARQMVIEKYDWDLIARQMRELFGRMLAGR